MKAFTLIEATMVILIMGVLATIALPSFTRHMERSRIQEAVPVLNSLRTAFRTYELQNNGAVPSGLGDLDVTIPTMDYFDTLTLSSVNYATSLGNCSASPCLDATAFIVSLDRSSNNCPFAITADGTFVCGDAGGTYDAYCNSVGVPIMIP